MEFYYHEGTYGKRLENIISNLVINNDIDLLNHGFSKYDDNSYNFMRLIKYDKKDWEISFSININSDYSIKSFSIIDEDSGQPFRCNKEEYNFIMKYINEFIENKIMHSNKIIKCNNDYNNIVFSNKNNWIMKLNKEGKIEFNEEYSRSANELAKEVISIIENCTKNYSCIGCKNNGKYENEIEYGYNSPCTACKRRATDNYE